MIVDVDHTKTLHKMHNEFPFLPEKMVGKVEKLVCSLYDKEGYFIHILKLRVSRRSK